MNEFTAALGILGAERLEEIVAWKNRIARDELDPIHPGRLELPDGMVSGFYKYIVFEPLERSTGKVYDEPCHRVMGHQVDLPNTDWVAENHWCAPLYYRPGRPPRAPGGLRVRALVTGGAGSSARTSSTAARRRATSRGSSISRPRLTTRPARSTP